ncbi:MULTISPECIES: hypothetical protein [unclassified Streptomyces]|nr:MULTISPECIES: hypothetical protein [unclassified Streptomyces]MCX5049640.1 hypothetical protein [Streptomyces sp. NBC_00474]
MWHAIAFSALLVAGALGAVVALRRSQAARGRTELDAEAPRPTAG